jgi:hypothetical protein
MLGAPTACVLLAVNASINMSSPVDTNSDEASRFMETSLSLAADEGRAVRPPCH